MEGMNEAFDAIQKDFQGMALKILEYVLLYLGGPIIVALLILAFVFKLKKIPFKLVSLLVIAGWTYFWAMNIFPHITDGY